MQILSMPQGDFSLQRYPVRPRETLRAWDAADEYLLQQLADEALPAKDSRVLIVNDNFGALSVALHPHQPTLISDSWLAHRATLNNLKENKLPPDGISLLDALSPPQGQFDLVLIRVPKSLAMLEDQLTRLRPHLHTESRILAAGMAKHIHTSTLKLFAQCLGTTTTSLARKKARLILTRFDPQLSPATDKYPSGYLLDSPLLDSPLSNSSLSNRPVSDSRGKESGGRANQQQYQVTNHAGVFSRDSLDIGTRFFLQHLPASLDEKHIIDLACGNGVVGLIAAERNPNARLTFVDESFMAVESARLNFNTAFGADTHKAKFQATDCLHGIAPNSADLILNNPPFHQQNVVGDFIARQMFRESKRVLRRGGDLLVVGNRHLGYHIMLKKLFGNCEVVASNKKFVILSARKA
ncbi:MAG: methyltransferase [Marinobacterium sp.]|nr:methyltransferase [Marinobacterium sp.]